MAGWAPEGVPSEGWPMEAEHSTWWTAGLPYAADAQHQHQWQHTAREPYTESASSSAAAAALPVGTAAPTTPDASYKIPGNLETARSLSAMWDEVVLALGPFAQEGLARLRLAFLESIVENSEVQPWYRDELTTPQLRDLQRSLVARDMLETVASIRRSMIQ